MLFSWQLFCKFQDGEVSMHLMRRLSNTSTALHAHVVPALMHDSDSEQARMNSAALQCHECSAAWCAAAHSLSQARSPLELRYHFVGLQLPSHGPRPTTPHDARLSLHLVPTQQGRMHLWPRSTRGHRRSNAGSCFLSPLSFGRPAGKRFSLRHVTLLSPAGQDCTNFAGGGVR